MQLVTTSNSQLQVGICEFHPPRIQTKRALAYCIVWLDLLLCWWNQDSHRARGHLQHTHLQKSPGSLGLSKQGSILKDKLPEAWRKHFCSFLRHFDQDKINPWLCEFPLSWCSGRKCLSFLSLPWGPLWVSTWVADTILPFLILGLLFTLLGIQPCQASNPS